MKNTTKVTLTFKQLKKLVTEAVSDKNHIHLRKGVQFKKLNEEDSLVEKARKINTTLKPYNNVLVYDKSDPFICYNDPETIITSFDFDVLREDNGHWPEFDDFNWNDKSKENCQKAVDILNEYPDGFNFDYCLNTPANFDKLLKKYAKDIVEIHG